MQFIISGIVTHKTLKMFADNLDHSLIFQPYSPLEQIMFRNLMNEANVCDCAIQVLWLHI